MATLINILTPSERHGRAGNKLITFQQRMKALTTKNLFDKKYKTFKLDGEYLKVFGEPETDGLWLIYGWEKNGKTALALMLADYFSRLVNISEKEEYISYRVLYVSAEEGTGKTFTDAVKRVIGEIRPKLHFIEYETLDELETRLQKRRAFDIVFIDNITYYADEVTKSRFKAFIRKNPNTLFIFIGHEERNEVDTALGRYIRKLSDIIIRVEGLAANVSGRCPGGVITIDAEKAAVYHGQEIATDSQI